MLGLILQRFPSPTKVTNVILPSDDVLGRGGDPKPAAQHRILPQKRGLFFMGNACRIGTSHAIEVQYGSFYAEFSDEQNKANYTSLACLVQKLQHLLKIAISGRWRCLLLKFPAAIKSNSSLYGNCPRSLKLMSHCLWDLLDHLQKK